MPEAASTAVAVQDHAVVHPDGELFARSWSPPRACGAPVLLFHDSLGCVALWREFPARLAASTGRRVIAYDRLGFGRSDPRRDRPGLDFVADEAVSVVPVLCAGLGVERFVALGHSVGGGMAIETAAAHRGACEALVTIAAQVFAEDRTLDGIRAAREQFRDPAQVERLARYHGEKAAWVLDAWIGTWLSPGFASWTLTDVLSRVRCPVLAIHGDRDEYGSTQHPALMARLAGGPVRVEVMADTGHVPHRERPDAVLSLVADALGAA
jgi:pimeloyl-ACP methyl ester carboxylesterase